MGHDPKDGKVSAERVYAVTARHVVDGLRGKGCSELLIRLNYADKDATLVVTIPLDKWFVHPTDKTIDVALYEMGIPPGIDHLVLPFSACATEKTFAENEVGLGDEVFVSGLFSHHYGTKKNIPIVRVGNLAALNEERIATHSFGEMDAYLVEARSTGGLSGSPVFLNLGAVRSIKGQLKHAKGGSMHFLLGLIHGHLTFEVKSETANEDINAGIAIVVPVSSIRSVVDEYEKAYPPK